MKITGKIVDGSNKEPLPSASVTVTDFFYAPLGPGTIADENGNFVLDSDILDNNNLVLVSFVGYEQAILSPQQAQGEISLKPASGSLGSVTVTAKKRVKQLKQNNTWYYVAVAATVAVWAGFTYYQVK